MPIGLSGELIQLQQATVAAQREAQASSYSAEAWGPWIEPPRQPLTIGEICRPDSKVGVLE
ncbi:hypothetical protein ACFU5Y_04405 [Streptomyces gardneri]|uniref:hypothetical protein n=1 Tax=Streptomyces gardneri TaxID=66892 RepID=UPI0036A8B441